LPILNENNVIEYDSVDNHIGGVGLSVSCQPDEKIVEIGVTDRSLVLIKDTVANYSIDLCRVEREIIQSSDEFGDILELYLREIDENLNPLALYYNLCSYAKEKSQQVNPLPPKVSRRNFLKGNSSKLNETR
jgi:hypothetical protein